MINKPFMMSSLQDQAVLSLQYISILDKLNVAKVFCAQTHPRHLTKRGIQTNDSTIDLGEPPLKPSSILMSDQNSQCVCEIHSTETTSILTPETPEVSGTSTPTGATTTNTSTLATAATETTSSHTLLNTTVSRAEKTPLSPERDLMTTSPFETSDPASSAPANPEKDSETTYSDTSTAAPPSGNTTSAAVTTASVSGLLVTTTSSSASNAASSSSSSSSAVSPPLVTTRAAQSTNPEVTSGKGLYSQNTAVQSSTTDNRVFAFTYPDSFWGFLTFPDSNY